MRYHATCNFSLSRINALFNVRMTPDSLPASYFDRRKRPSLASSSTSLSSSSPPSYVVYLVCYRISDPSTLFSAVNNWCPAIRARDPNAPIVLVGCQSDLRYWSLTSL